MNLIRNILNSRPKKDENFFYAIQELVGFKPNNLKPYKKAFTHRSLNKIDELGNAINYERLEFLGDAMLSAIIAAHLFKEVPSGNEGYLTKMRAKVVSRKHLNELGKDLHLVDLIKTNVPTTQFSSNIHGNLFEALIGAIYLDKGYKSCHKFIKDTVIDPYVDIEQLETQVISYKSLLIEYCQKTKKQFHYEVYEDTGVDEMKHFAVKLRIDKKVVAKARATSKKKAEEKASKRAFFVLQAKIKKVFE